MSPARNILSKSRLNSLLVLLLCCLPASLVRAEGRGAESRLTSAHLVEAKPGTIVTASILVANRSEAEAMYEEAFTIPPAWRLISPLESHLSLQPGEQKLRVIAFAIPATSPEGSFDLKYALTTSGHVSPAAISTLTVIVLPVVKLELLREDQTDTVIAGEIYEARLRLINRGNNKIRVSIEAVCAPVAPVHLMS